MVFGLGARGDLLLVFASLDTGTNQAAVKNKNGNSTTISALAKPVTKDKTKIVILSTARGRPPSRISTKIVLLSWFTVRDGPSAIKDETQG